MRSFTILSVFAAATAVKAQSTPAPIISGNPGGAVFVAELPDKNTTTVRGSLQISSTSDGKGVEVGLSFTGFPNEGGPFMYHIHEKPVPADGNCTATGAHLDPYKRGEVPLCDSTKPETCQTGDLSGKHGNITSETWNQKYSDLYLATMTNDPSYFGNLSVVVHTSNKTRISCANFKVKGNSTGTTPGTTAAPSSGPLPTGGLNSTLPISSHINTGGPVPTSAPTQQPGSAAHRVAVGTGAFAVAAAALLLL